MDFKSIVVLPLPIDEKYLSKVYTDLPTLQLKFQFSPLLPERAWECTPFSGDYEIQQIPLMKC